MVSDLIQQCIYENAHVAMNQEDYQKRYDALTDRFNKAKARLEEINTEIQKKQFQRAGTEAFLKSFEQRNQKEKSTFYCKITFQKI